MTPREFILKWREHALTERAAAHSHFIDICRLVGHPTPSEADPRGETYAFEKGASKTSGGDGFADVWKQGFFAWEYKKRKRDLDAAMKQLADYSAALDNPPVHVACDTIEFRIQTRWTNTVSVTHAFALEDLMDDRNLAVLRAVFHDPEALKPKETRASLTKEAADEFQRRISDRLQERHPNDREAVAHFVNQLVFCFFADSVKLLPPGQPGVWKKMLIRATEEPAGGNANLATLFRLMAEKGGEFALERIRWFNGKLFDGRPPLPLDADDFHHLLAMTSMKWDLIDPTIFGTLFERFLDPDKRAQIGAHYTDPDKIMLIVEPVVLRPLRAEWAAARAEIDAALAKKGPAALKKATAIRDAFLTRLRTLAILDPACGSGNFLYLALQHVKDLELKAIRECEPLGLDRVLPAVGPGILRGIEINPFAAELARAVIWIGDLQWQIRNDLLTRVDPVLQNLDSIECRDALVDWRGASFETPAARAPQDEEVGSESASNGPHAEEARSAVSKHAQPTEAPWPEAEFIVGNPPFLGDRRMISGLGESYVTSLRELYSDRIPGRSDLVCYWFAKGADAVHKNPECRVGFVATNSIAGGNNLPTLQYVTSVAKIFNAWSDMEWTIDGAAVRVALVCFSSVDVADSLLLDGEATPQINADLTSGSAVASANRLAENSGVSFIGTQKNGPFDIAGAIARDWLRQPLNVNGRPNADVVRSWTNGSGIVRRDEDRWIVDFGSSMSEQEAMLFELPFAHVREFVKPTRENLRREWHKTKWWLHGDPRPALRDALKSLQRFICTPLVSKHRIFTFLPSVKVPENTVIAIARDDDTTFGILHSRFHEAWSLRLGTWLGVGNDPRYTPTTTFETFPFPEGLTPDIPAADYAADPRANRIAEAARKLDDLRRAWLYPADLGSWEPEMTPTAAPGEAPRKYPDRFIPRNVEAAAKLKQRTLTNLYNQRPQWLASAREALDRAVAAAYGWPEDIATEEALARLLALNLERAAAGR